MVDTLLAITEGRIPQLDFVARDHTFPAFVPRQPRTPPPERPEPPSPHAGRGPRTVSSREPLRTPTDRVDELAALTGKAEPERPVDWATVEQVWGLRPPSDYRHLIERLGPGQYGDIELLDPAGAVDDPSSVLGAMNQIREEMEKARPPATRTPPLPPDRDALLVWGRAPHGWWCVWAPAGREPDQLPVLLIHPVSGATATVYRSASDYLTCTLRSPDVTFQPWSEASIKLP
jgi:hypothetical protein